MTFAHGAVNILFAVAVIVLVFSLPIMLFTNGEEDIRFYLKNGFKIIGVTSSEEFGFENTYVLYEPRQQGAQG